jgi:hypothetical protein
VLAYKIDAMIRSGEIRGWAEAARLASVTRARMTQIANLLLLAPDIQEAILARSGVVETTVPLTERWHRTATTHPQWKEQRRILSRTRRSGEMARATHQIRTELTSQLIQP